MPNLKTHLAIGVFAYPAYLLGYSLLSKEIGFSFDPGIELTIAGYLAFIVGSDLPDIDHKDAPIHHQLKALSIPFLAAAFYVWFSKYFEQDLSKYMGSTITKAVLFAFAAVIGYLVLSAVVALFKHRGFTHTITFAILYGGILYFVSRLLEVSREDAIYLASAGFVGDVIHLIADYRRTPHKIFRLW